MRRDWAGLGLVLSLVMALPAWANGLTLSPSLLGCLTPSAALRGTPDYPANEWQNGSPGRVLVELIFTGPDLRPEVTIVESEGGPAFVESVRRHVRNLRLPCLEAADIPARTRFDFVFSPTEREALPPEAIDPELAEWNRLLQCVVAPPKLPEYPVHARRSELQGRVSLEMRFTSADGPPMATLLARPSSEPFLAPITRWAQGFRLPCFNGRVLRTSWNMVFRLEGDAPFGFRETSLVQFLGSIRDIERQRVQFDFNTMGCPFELRLTYLQPLAKNRLTQISQPHPARQPFLDWLSSAELKLTDRAHDAVFADSVVLRVPCGKFDLQPKG